MLKILYADCLGLFC